MGEEFQEVETTRGEKILAAALVMFLLISSIQILEKLEDIPDYPDWSSYEIRFGVDVLRENVVVIQNEWYAAENVLVKAKTTHDKAAEDYWFASKEYELMLQRGENTTEIVVRYEEATTEFETTNVILESAQENVNEIKSRLVKAESELRTQEIAMNEELSKAWRIYQLKVLVLRLSFTIPMFILAILIFLKARTRASLYMIHANAFMAFSALLLAYMTIDYLWNTLSIIGLGLIGAASSAIALAYLKKSLFSFERISQSRVRKNQCYSCGFPFSPMGEDEYCRSCGNRVMDTCSECKSLQFTQLPYCHHCGHPSKPS